MFINLPSIHGQIVHYEFPFLLKNHESRVENLHKVKMSLTSKYQLFK